MYSDKSLQLIFKVNKMAAAKKEATVGCMSGVERNAVITLLYCS